MDREGAACSFLDSRNAASARDSLQQSSDVRYDDSIGSNSVWRADGPPSPSVPIPEPNALRRHRSGGPVASLARLLQLHHHAFAPRRPPPQCPHRPDRRYARDRAGAGLHGLGTPVRRLFRGDCVLPQCAGLRQRSRRVSSHSARRSRPHRDVVGALPGPDHRRRAHRATRDRSPRASR